MLGEGGGEGQGAGAWENRGRRWERKGWEAAILRWRDSRERCKKLIFVFMKCSNNFENENSKCNLTCI